MNFFSYPFFFLDQSKLVVYVIRRIFLNVLLNFFVCYLIDAVIQVLNFLLLFSLPFFIFSSTSLPFSYVFTSICETFDAF